MSNQGRMHQHGRPFWIPSLDETEAGYSLKRLTFSAGNEDAEDFFSEAWLQRLLHRIPQSLPIPEIEPGIGELIPVGMEVPTPAGFLDNLFVTVSGNLVLAECKLWRNPEARRRVISQIIDYAQSISSWNYENLDAAIRLSSGVDGKKIASSMIELVKSSLVDETEFDEVSFIDAVQKNLRMGRMLLLVIGDGIRQDIESLTGYLQMHAGFHFTLGLVEVAIFRAPEGGLIVQPRVLARTLNIERAIVRLVDNVLTAQPSVGVTLKDSRARGVTMTEELFFEKISASSPETASSLSSFLELASDCGLYLGPATKSAALRWDSPQGDTLNLGAIDLDGNLQTYAVGWIPNRLGFVDLSHNYLSHLARLMGASVKETPNQGQWHIVKNTGGYPPAIEALTHASEWLELIRDYQLKIINLKQEMVR